MVGKEEPKLTPLSMAAVAMTWSEKRDLLGELELGRHGGDGAAERPEAVHDRLGRHTLRPYNGHHTTVTQRPLHDRLRRPPPHPRSRIAARR